jgi:hypothetical protein
MKTMTTIAMALLTLSVAYANPDERMRMVKASWLQRLSQDGWQLVQESPSQLTFEKQSGFAQTFLMRTMTGANGSWAVDRLSVAFVPVNDHHTNYFCTFSVNGQNAFGQTTSVPINNKRTDAYIKGVKSWASARLPAKYSFDGDDRIK